MPVLNSFSATYSEARDKFLSAAKRRGAKLTSHRHPSAKGPNGEDLFTDVACIGPESATAALLVISGTHGVEGYAGSAVQVGWFSESMDSQPLVKQVFVHALNPYGFAWDRRVTEENVDLNRNFVAHTKPYPENPDYEGLKYAIAPADLQDETLESASRALRNYAKEFGAFAMQETISKGQYTHPQGLYFGGQRPQWSATLLRHITETEMASCRRAAVVDIHTGLGAYGDAELISEDPPEAPSFQRARQWWGPSVCSTRDGGSVSAQVFGSLDSAIPTMLSHAETTMICLEYGTYSTLEVFQALRADNWLHNNNDPHAAAATIKAQIRRAFYPDLPDWKERVWTRGQAVLRQATQGVASA